MTAISLDFTMFGARRPERGVGSDADELQRRIDEVFLTPPSITLGEAKVDLLGNIRCAAHGAAVPNWDGEGAEAVEQSTVCYAEAFAAALPTDVEAPEISVDRDGDISFEWDFDARRTFSVSVSRDGIIHFAGLFGTGRIHGSEVLAWGIPTVIAQYIRRASREV